MNLRSPNSGESGYRKSFTAAPSLRRPVATQARRRYQWTWPPLSEFYRRERLDPAENVMPETIQVRLALGGDHAGFPLKTAVAQRFGSLVTELIDCGTDSEESCDYPDFAVTVARQIVRGNADRGILVCGSGVGVSVAASKIPGIRAAICHDTYSAHQGVEHDDMNVLCIGGRIIGSELAFEIIEAFLRATYTPADRHARRLDKVLEIERRGLKAL